MGELQKVFLPKAGDKRPPSSKWGGWGVGYVGAGRPEELSLGLVSVARLPLEGGVAWEGGFCVGGGPTVTVKHQRRDGGASCWVLVVVVVWFREHA